METLSIELLFPEGKIPKGGADPEGFIKRVSMDLKEVQKRLPKSQLVDLKRTPPPKGAAGIGELVQWTIQFYVQNKEVIDPLLLLVVKLLSDLSEAYKHYKLEQSMKGRVKVEIAGKSLNLPASAETIESFVDAVRKAFPTPNEKQNN